MIAFAFSKESERYDPQKKIDQLVRRVVTKIKQEEIISEKLFDKDYGLGKDLKKLNKELEEENFPLVSEEEILEKALYQLKEDTGGFPSEKLEKAFKEIEEMVVERIAKQIVEKLQKEGEKEREEKKHELLADYGKELKKKGVDIGKKLGERVDELLELIERLANEIIQEIQKNKEEYKKELKYELLRKFGLKIKMEEGIDIEKELGKRVDELLELEEKTKTE